MKPPFVCPQCGQTETHCIHFEWRSHLDEVSGDVRSWWVVGALLGLAAILLLMSVL